MCDPEQKGFPPLYSAFLLRCWWRNGRWHFSLENIASREKWHASSLDDLIANILLELGDQSELED